MAKRHVNCTCGTEARKKGIFDTANNCVCYIRSRSGASEERIPGHVQVNIIKDRGYVKQVK